MPAARSSSAWNLVDRLPVATAQPEGMTLRTNADILAANDDCVPVL
jgi:hypothetical protein